MHIAFIVDSFLPENTSGIVQTYDLCTEFAKQGYKITIIVPTATINNSWVLEKINDFEVLKLKSPQFRDIGLIKRFLGEFFMPLCMIYNYRKTTFNKKKWDGIIWYSPSIFHGLFVRYLKGKNKCKSYLIIRDIFPNWLKDLKLISTIPYTFLSIVAKYQYSLANTIGVQTQGNLHYFNTWRRRPHRTLEVLHNWLNSDEGHPCNIQIHKTSLAGKNVFIYAGNMGIAQDMKILIELVIKLQYRNDIGFLFIGRGSETQKLKAIAKERKLSNILFFDEVNSNQIPNLYAQCSVGLISLNRLHKSHNIPGKFISYMRSGLPVLASVNPGNDLIENIRKNQIGKVCDNGDINHLSSLAIELLNNLSQENDYSSRCKEIFQQQHSVTIAANQIINQLNNNDKNSE